MLARENSLNSMSNCTDWESINPYKLGLSSKETLGKVQVEVSLSPRDIPTAIKFCSREDTSNGSSSTEICFKYSGEEEPLRRISTNSVDIFLGSYSDRVWRIFYFGEQLNNVIDVLRNIKSKSWRESQNHKVAAEIINSLFIEKKNTAIQDKDLSKH